MIDVFYPIPKLLDTILTEIYAENRRKHEERMAELQVISNSSLRDAYAQQLLLDRFLAPVENAQHSIQNAAKHAQYMAEVVNYYHHDHGLLFSPSNYQDLNTEKEIILGKGKSERVF